MCAAEQNQNRNQFGRRQRRSEEGGGTVEGAPVTDHKHSRRARVLQQAAKERYRRLKIGTSRDALEMSSRKKNLKYLLQRTNLPQSRFKKKKKQNRNMKENNLRSRNGSAEVSLGASVGYARLIFNLVNDHTVAIRRDPRPGRRCKHKQKTTQSPTATAAIGG